MSALLQWLVALCGDHGDWPFPDGSGWLLGCPPPFDDI